MDIKRKFIHRALRELGGATSKKYFLAMAHHRIFGMYLMACELDGISSDLNEIEQASTRLWLHADVGDGNE